MKGDKVKENTMKYWETKGWGTRFQTSKVPGTQRDSGGGAGNQCLASRD